MMKALHQLPNFNPIPISISCLCVIPIAYPGADSLSNTYGTVTDCANPNNLCKPTIGHRPKCAEFAMAEGKKSPKHAF